MSLDLREADSENALDDICASLGLPVYRRPEWVHTDFGGDYRLTVSLIAENIICIQPSGYARRQDVAKALAFTDDAISEAIPQGARYIHIEDHSHLRGVARDARKLYLGFMKRREHLRVLFCVQMARLLRMRIALAHRFNLVLCDVRFLDGLAEAVESASKYPLRQASLQEAPIAPSESPQPLTATAGVRRYRDTVSHADWSVDFSDFSARFEIRSGDIFHWTSAGSFKAKHIPPIFAINGQAMETLHRPASPYYYLLGVEEIRSFSLKARKAYVTGIRDWYDRYPFKMLIFYGANRMLRAGINLASPFVPFKVCTAEDLDGALALIDEDRSGSSRTLTVSAADTGAGEADTLGPIEGYVNEIIHYLGSIGLGTDGTDTTKEIDKNHPFSPVFDAIKLIKVGLEQQLHERIRAEEARAELSAQLQRVQRLDAIGNLAGGVAHDLNNILSGVISYPEMLLMDLPEDSPLRGPLSNIQKSGQKAAAIVQDLLTLAKRGLPVPEVVDLNRVVTEYLESPEHASVMSFHPKLRLGTVLSPDLLNVYGSPAHITKSTMNLVSNAAEAMPVSGDVAISTENRYIDTPVTGYDTVREGDYVVLSVTDEGAGMSSDDIERVFEPFYTKEVMGRSGTGLGMAVVWGTVKDHDGYIDVKSGRGKGTTFALYFPATQEEMAIPRPMPMASYVGEGERILVVDDVREQREIAARMLERLGYAVTSVSSGEAAIEYSRKEPADLLLRDMIVDPGIDGLDTYRSILAIRPGQKAIIASGFAETSRVKEAMSMGVGAYIKKPYTMETIGMAVRSELNRPVSG